MCPMDTVHWKNNYFHKPQINLFNGQMHMVIGFFPPSDGNRTHTRISGAFGHGIRLFWISTATRLIHQQFNFKSMSANFPFILRQPARFFTSFSCSKSFWVVFQSWRKQFAFQLKSNRNVFFLLLKNRYVFLPTKKIVWNNQMLMIKLSLAYLHWCF